jgi:DNA-directed RNA polymerase specialized sigma subunit
MRTVTNEEYNLALKNEDYIKIGKSILRKFKFNIDLRRECWLIGLWDALRNYNSSKKIKFTTYLYYRILWLAIRKAKQNTHELTYLDSKVTVGYEDSYLDEIFEIIPSKYRKIVYSKYVDNMTIKELSEKYSLSSQTITKYIKIGLDYLKLEKNGV